MLATAFIVGPPDGAAAPLHALAEALDFTAVLPFRDVAQAEQQVLRTPLCFFLFAPVTAVEHLAGPAAAVRFSPHRRLRFSPLIHFAEAPSLDTIRACAGMGFDDVITLPFEPERIRERLARQVDRAVSFFETQGYFGPDRRDRLPPDPALGERRAAGAGQHRRIEIVRTVTAGVQVLHDDAHVAV